MSIQSALFDLFSLGWDALRVAIGRLNFLSWPPGSSRIKPQASSNRAQPRPSRGSVPIFIVHAIHRGTSRDDVFVADSLLSTLGRRYHRKGVCTHSSLFDPSCSLRFALLPSFLRAPELLSHEPLGDWC